MSAGGTSGLLAVLSGPSGAGKSTIIKKLLEDPRFSLSVSATTRAPRAGESDGVHYHFITRAEFEKRIAAGEFIEYAVVHGQNMYGTLRREVQRLTADGKVVILDIDVQGARQIRDRFPAVFVFIAPPDMETLKRRLKERGSEDAASLARRLETATVEMDARSEYDHIVVNDVLEDAVRDVKKILAAPGEKSL